MEAEHDLLEDSFPLQTGGWYILPRLFQGGYIYFQ